MKKIASYIIVSLATLGLGYVGGKELIISASATGSDEPVEQIIEEEVEAAEVEETETVETEVTEEVETPAAPAQPVVEQAPVRQPTVTQQPQYQPQEKTYSITVITPEVDTDASIEVQEQSLNDVPEMSMEEACAILASKGMSCTAE